MIDPDDLASAVREWRDARRELIESPERTIRSAAAYDRLAAAEARLMDLARKLP